MISWAGQDVEPTFQVQAYIRLIGLMCLAFGVGFIIPVLLVFLELIRVITPQQLLALLAVRARVDLLRGGRDHAVGRPDLADRAGGADDGALLPGDPRRLDLPARTPQA